MAKDNTLDKFLWAEKYRPRTLNNMVLETPVRTALESYIAQQNIPHLLFYGSAGSGKALPNDEVVLTPSGWKQMGDIKVGDEVISIDGKPTRVIGVYPQGEKAVYKVYTDDGASCRASEDHLWITSTYYDREKRAEGSVKTTLEIKNTLRARGGTHRNHALPFMSPVQFNDRELPIHPYILGAWIGDGTKNDIKIWTPDKEVWNHIKEVVPEGVVVSEIQYENKCPGITFTAYPHKEGCNPIRNGLRELGLLGQVSSDTVFIPEIYFTASIASRMELLSGLVDTDGGTKDRVYSTVSERLAHDIQRLVWSLGGKSKIRIKQGKYKKNGETHICKKCYGVLISLPTPVKLGYVHRKAQAYSVEHQPRYHTRYIEDVVYDGTYECTCIRVAHESHLFITRDYIPTHNTTIAKILMDSIPCSTLVLNASGKDRSIETMRKDVADFCRAMPPRGIKLKIVFLDEADGITPQAQESLKNTMETYSDTCRFILTANHVNRIIDPLRSRCTEWAFTTFSKPQATQMCESILQNEQVAYQNTDVATVVERCYPDIRRLMNTLQRCSIGGTFSMDKVASMTVSPEQVFQCIKTGKMKSLRQLIAGMTDFTYLYREMFDNIENLVPTGDQQGTAATQLCQHLFYDPTVPDREINFVACCAEWSMILNVAPDFGK